MRMNDKSSKMWLAGVDLPTEYLFCYNEQSLFVKYIVVCFSYCRNTMIHKCLKSRLFISFNYFCLSPILMWISRHILRVNH